MTDPLNPAPGRAPEVRERIQGLFSRFDESIALSEAAVSRARTLDFVALMRQLDARAFPDDPS